MKELNVIISGGGTGGHIYPAISIANEIKRRYPLANILFVGAKDRMEMTKVPEAGYPIEGLWITGIDRKFSLRNLAFPLKLVSSLVKANKILGDFKPQVVIGTGGFASGPLLKMANNKKIPTLIQEQNSYPGITNRMLGKEANVICTAYENLGRYFLAEKIRVTGNPVREDIVNIKEKREESRKFFEIKANIKTLLVLGGSLGARKINKLIEANLAYFERNQVQVIWQTGSLYYEDYKKFDSETIKTYAFLNRMDLAYAAADVIISRAGAGTVSELCIVGKPVLFIPSPNVAEDHQLKNALSIVSKKAAFSIKEDDLLEEFEETITLMLENREVQEELSENIKKLAKPMATAAIVDEIEKLIKV